jgi:hypothetical protein
VAHQETSRPPRPRLATVAIDLRGPPRRPGQCSAAPGPGLCLSVPHLAEPPSSPVRPSSCSTSPHLSPDMIPSAPTAPGCPGGCRDGAADAQRPWRLGAHPAGRRAHRADRRPRPTRTLRAHGAPDEGNLHSRTSASRQSPEVPQPVGVALVGVAEPAGADLGAAGPLQQGRGRGVLGVVKVAEHDHRPVLAVPVEQLVGPDADGRGFGGSPVEGVGGVAGALVLVVAGEPVREPQQLELETTADQLHLLAGGGGNGDLQRGARQRGRGRGLVVDLHRRQARRVARD